MKKRNFLFTVVLLIISTLFIISASAHPGNTDSKGGHWNHSTGEYHYHTGEYAGRGSSGSSSYKSSSSFKPPYNPPAKDSSVNSDSDDMTDTTIPLILSSVVISILLFGFILILIGSIRNREAFPLILYIFFSYGGVLISLDATSPSYDFFGVLVLVSSPALVMAVINIGYFFLSLSPRYNLKQYEEHLTRHINCLTSIYKKRIKLNELEEFSTIPDKYILGHDGLIREKTSVLWGDTFTLYVSLYDKTLHCKRGCCNARYTEHIYNHLDSDNFCYECFTEDMRSTIEWLKKYREYNLIKKEYDHLITHRYYPSEDLLASYKICNSKYIKFLLFFSKKQRQRLSDLNNKYHTYISTYSNK